jgi:hypothetical protein
LFVALPVNDVFGIGDFYGKLPQADFGHFLVSESPVRQGRWVEVKSLAIQVIRHFVEDLAVRGAAGNDRIAAKDATADVEDPVHVPGYAGLVEDPAVKSGRPFRIVFPGIV